MPLNPTEKLKDLLEWWETQSWVLRIRLRMLILGMGILAIFFYSLENWGTMTEGGKAVLSIVAFLLGLGLLATVKEVFNL
jgi:hypothetical protein